MDVRSPAEYAKGHVPGALSFPLFSDEERAVVGTLYKQVSKNAAVMKGLEMAGAKMANFVKEAKELVPGNEVALHCWRGGKRSSSLATLLEFMGYDVQVLEGGYKAYRNLALGHFLNKKLKLLVLGGKTGSAKTEVLHEMEKMGEQVIDLEGLANHKGSAFGALGEKPQPTVEQFENNLFEVFRKLDFEKRVWIENESKAIGCIYVPDGLWAQMCSGILIELEVPFEKRIGHLVQQYAHFPKGEIIAALEKIRKRLGGQNVKAAQEAFEAGDMATAASFALKYYDKSYQYGTDKKAFSEKHVFETSQDSFVETAKNLIHFADKHNF